MPRSKSPYIGDSSGIMSVLMGNPLKIYLAYWKFQHFVMLPGLMARRFGEPGWDWDWPAIH